MRGEWWGVNDDGWVMRGERWWRVIRGEWWGQTNEVKWWGWVMKGEWWGLNDEGWILRGEWWGVLGRGLKWGLRVWGWGCSGRGLRGGLRQEALNIYRYDISELTHLPPILKVLRFYFWTYFIIKSIKILWTMCTLNK